MIVNYIWKMSFLRIGRKIQELYYNLFFFECVYRYLDLKAIEKVYGYLESGEAGFQV